MWSCDNSNNSQAMRRVARRTPFASRVHPVFMLVICSKSAIRNSERGWANYQANKLELCALSQPPQLPLPNLLNLHLLG